MTLAGSRTNYSSRAVDVVRRSPVIDMLGLITLDEGRWDAWAHSADGLGAEDLRDFRDSGIAVFHHAFGIGGTDAHREALAYFADLNGFVARYGDAFARVSTVRELDALAVTGKVGIIPGLQNSEHFRTPDDVALFHKLGQRVSQLTYNRQNLLGSGGTERVDGGVSDFGAAIIEKMNAAGMLIDVSHCGDRTTLDAFELSTKPVAITHSNCRALLDHPRLKTDEAIKKMAAQGGVMGITGVRAFVRGSEPTTIEHMVDHIAHVIDLVGPEFVGIGSDSDLRGYDALPAEQNQRLRAAYKDSYALRERIDIEGFEHSRKVFDLTEALIRRGYDDTVIVGILGGNFRRLLGEVWV